MLTSAQLQVLKANLTTNTNTVLINGIPTAINVVPHGAQNAQTIADWYNLIATTPFFGFYSNVPVAGVIGAIKWKRLTPTDAIPVDTPLNNAIWQSRALACQGFQFNVQLMIGFQSVIDATQKQIVQGFNDSLSAVPSGAGGATVDAGWLASNNGVQGVLCRLSSNAVVLFADTSAGNGSSNTTPATLVFQGNLSGNDIINAWAS